MRTKDVEINGVTQRFVWIEPGMFMMGSQLGERARLSDEVQHIVTLTRGYWLADTACTQGLWDAVMGENLSSFCGPDRPVERVSWNRAQDFMSQMNAAAPGMDLRLPTEEEWEYACRAGTTTPFSFGEDITPEYVNYDGRYPYTGRAKGLYRKETVPVKSLPPNAWGLYEMHGNVWEWCSDWHKPYAEDIESHKFKSVRSRFARIARGGGWTSAAADSRSAYRGEISPSSMSLGIGFRIVSGSP